MAPPLTPGRITALWLVLTSLKKLGAPANREEVVGYAKDSPLRSGALPIQDGLELALRGRFMREQEDALLLTTLGSELLAKCREDEPNHSVRRTVLSVMLLADPQPWVAFWQGDPEVLTMALPTEQRQLLKEVGLFPHEAGKDFAADAWWEALGTVPRTRDIDKALKIIGDAGEQLTMRFEAQRLIAEGFPELAKRVWWAARESDAYGFDVASFAGSSYASLAPDAPLAIEVKSTSVPATKVFPLYLSRYEWQTAKRLGDQHVFHLWDAVRPAEPKARLAAPRVVRLGAVMPHLPGVATCAEPCRWENAKLALTLAPEHVLS